MLKPTIPVVRLEAADRRQPLEDMLPDVESKESYIVCNLGGYHISYI